MLETIKRKVLFFFLARRLTLSYLFFGCMGHKWHRGLRKKYKVPDCEYAPWTPKWLTDKNSALYNPPPARSEWEKKHWIRQRLGMGFRNREL